MLRGPVRWRWIASAQADDGPPLYFDSSSSNSEDAAGPALASPSNSENTVDRTSSVNYSRSSHGNYNGSQSQYSNPGNNNAGNYGASNNGYSRNAGSQQNYNRGVQQAYQANGQPNYQTADRRSGGSDRQSTNSNASNAQSHWGGYPGYQQALHDNSLTNNYGNSGTNNNGQDRADNNVARPMAWGN